MGDVYLNPISADLIAEAKSNAVKAQEENPCLTGRFIVVLCDSHEALRARVAELEAEVGRLTKERDAYKHDFDVELDGNIALRRKHGARDGETMWCFFERIVGERDAALVRAEAAEAREAGLREAMEGFAERDCEYGDCCPTFGTRHGKCVGCLARAALAAAPLCPRCANRDNCCVATLDRFHDYDFARCKMFVEEPTERRTR